MMSKIWIIILAVFTSSCSKLFDAFGYTEMSVNIVNDSGLAIKKVGFYANISVDASKKYADSTIVENILMNNSKQIVVKRNNKMGGEGAFDLLLTFENGTVKKSGCCYYTGNRFQTSSVDFEVKKDSILVKSTFRK